MCVGINLNCISYFIKDTDGSITGDFGFAIGDGTYQANFTTDKDGQNRYSYKIRYQFDQNGECIDQHLTKLLITQYF